MLDIVDLAGKGAARQRAKLMGDAGDLFAIAQSTEQEMRAWAARCDVGKFAEEISVPAAIDGDMRNVPKIGLGFVQAVGNGLRGKAGPMFDSAEPFLLNRGYQD